MRLIDADNIIHALETFADIEHGNHHFMYGIESAKEIVTESETIDAVPVVRGEWVKKSSEEAETLALCSKCSYPISWWHKTNYCPNCGALMEDKT